MFAWGTSRVVSKEYRHASFCCLREGAVWYYSYVCTGVGEGGVSMCVLLHAGLCGLTQH